MTQTTSTNAKAVKLAYDCCRCLGQREGSTTCAERDTCKRYIATFSTGGERVPYTACLNPSPGQECPYKIELEKD